MNIGHGGIGAGGHKSVLCIEGHDHHDAQTQTYQIGDVPHDLGSNTMQAGDKEIQPDQTGLVVQGDDADKCHPQKQNAAQLGGGQPALVQKVAAAQLGHDQSNQAKDHCHNDPLSHLGNGVCDLCQNFMLPFLF